jgi:hypothetical protein
MTAEAKQQQKMHSESLVYSDVLTACRAILPAWQFAMHFDDFPERECIESGIRLANVTWVEQWFQTNPRISSNARTPLGAGETEARNAEFYRMALCELMTNTAVFFPGAPICFPSLGIALSNHSIREMIATLTRPSDYDSSIYYASTAPHNIIEQARADMIAEGVHFYPVIEQ